MNWGPDVRSESPLPRWHDGRAAIPEGLLAKARELRKGQTSAEEMLWACIRDRQLLRAKFRRQHVVGNWIADFYCHEARLVVEVDGPVHEGRQREDEERQRAIEALGYHMLRFSNERVLRRTDEVLIEIASSLFALTRDEAG